MTNHPHTHHLVPVTRTASPDLRAVRGPRPVTPPATVRAARRVADALRVAEARCADLRWVAR